MVSRPYVDRLGFQNGKRIIIFCVQRDGPFLLSWTRRTW